MGVNIRSEREIQRMRTSGKIVDGALQLAGQMIEPGLRTSTLNEEIEKFIAAQGAIPSFKNYPPGAKNPFPAGACISINDVVVHGIPGETVLQEGDIVSVDIGAYLGGFHGDAARTFPVGHVSAEVARLVRVTEQSFWAGIAQAKDGARLGDLSAAVQATAEASGFGVVREMVGHGVGANLHEEPDVPNFGRAGHGIRLRKGMTIAVEPMINMGTADIFMEEDGWTVRTADGLPSAHYENTIVITDGEPEILTLYEQD